MSIKDLYKFNLKNIENNTLTFELENEKIEAKIFVLEQDIFRVLFINDGKLKLKNTWTIAPGMEDIPFEGRDKFDLSPYALPKFNYQLKKDLFIIETEKLKAEIDLNGFKIAWFRNKNDFWEKIAQDRKTQSYNFGYWGKDLYHYLERNLDEEYYGFGEKAGKLNKHGKRMRMLNLDPMGYDAEYSDPLYKHLPFYITRNKKTKASFGIYYDNMSTAIFEMGSELDNYHGLYRYFQSCDGDLDYYFIVGNKISDITERFSWLTGKTIFSPKWSLGYSGSTMQYTEMEDAQDQLNNFLSNCQEYNIPCDSFQLSSGYTSINGKRYVFNWNHTKFYDIKSFTNTFKKNGVRLCANIKPGILKDHPLFEELKNNDLLIKEKDSNNPEMVQYWDEMGAYIDFTNVKSCEWWKKNVKKQLLEYGIDSTWNDNNEYEIWNKEARCNGFGNGYNIELIKPLMSMLMMKASYEAQKEFSPEIRPYLISRAGLAGIQRYVQTWSGDNRTSWNNLKYNIRMGLGYVLSGMYNIGHDVGGFAGEAPEPELFVRWIQNGIFHPRFTIHSWNDDQSVNVPWMYKEVLSEVKEAMNFRVKIIPYIYDLLYKAHTYYTPIIKPVFYDFEYDEKTFEDSDDFMLGNILVASVVEKGATKRKIYLPKDVFWYNYNNQEIYLGGREVEVDVKLKDFPIFIKEGSIIPINLSKPEFNMKKDERGFIIYPTVYSNKIKYNYFDDDGLSYSYLKGEKLEISFMIDVSEKDINILINKNGNYKPLYKEIEILLPIGEKRNILFNNTKIELDKKGNYLSFKIEL